MLTKVLSSTGINMVNDEVSKVYESISNNYKPGKYLTLTPAQRFEVDKRAAEYDVIAATLAYFDKLRIVWTSRLPFAIDYMSLYNLCFCTPVPLLKYGVIPYQLILMVASNHRFY